MARIVRLQSENVKRLVAVDIRPDGSLVLLGGKNAQGKSSVIDAIEMALGGAKKIPAEPVRKGQRRAKTVIELDNGLVVTRTFDAGGAGGSKLEVRDKNAAGAAQKSPQAILDALVGAISFDPLAYSRKDPKEQAKLLREIAGVDTTAMDGERAALFEERTEQNREVKRLKAQVDTAPYHADAPKQPVSVAALTEQLEMANAGKAANDTVRREASTADQEVKAAVSRLEEIDEELAAMRDRLAEAEQERAEQASAVEEARRQAADLRERVAQLADPDTASVREQLRTAEETNRKVRENAAKAELENKLTAAERAANLKTDAIARIDEERAKMLGAAKFPVPGLGFDADGVTLNGVPLNQASQAEQLQLSMAIGLACNPTLRVLLVREGSFLDEDALALVAKWAEEHDVQCWLERVGDKDASAIIIEDGQVRGAELPASDEDAAQ